jgi:hypothetical protein
MVAVFERAKTFHALDRGATMIGHSLLWNQLNVVGFEFLTEVNMECYLLGCDAV